MADIAPVYGITDFGSLLSSYGEGQANIAQTQAQTAMLNAQRQQMLPAQVASTQAGTAMTQAQTQGQQYQNAFTQARLQQLRANADSLQSQPAVNDQTAVPGQTPGMAAPAPQTPAATPSADSDSDELTLQDAGLDPASITQHAQTQFAVPPTLTDGESNQLAMAAANKLYGLPDTTDAIKASYAARVATATAHQQLAASAAYDNAAAVVNAPAGTALTTLSRASADGAQHAAAFTQMATKNGWSPAQTDQFVRTYATEVADAVHKYSGRDITVGADGVARDSQTQLPVPGANPIGLSQAQHADALSKAQDVVPVKQPDGSVKNYPKWQADGAPSAEAWINGSNGGAGTYTPHPSSPVANAPTSQPHVVTGAAPGTAPAAGGYSPPPQPPQIAQDPVLSKALADPAYAQQTATPVKPSATASAPSAEQQATLEAQGKANVENRQGLIQDAKTDTTTGSQSLVYLNAAQQILQSHGAPLGGGPLAGIYANTLATLHLAPNSVGAYQAVAKYLGNAALQGIAERFGTSRTTGNEVQLQMDKLAPSPNMNDVALNELLGKQKAYAQYLVDSGNRVFPYLQYGGAGRGGDPAQFPQWNHANYPAEKIVNAGSAGAPATGGASSAVTSKAQYDALPSGSTYTFNGRTGVKP